MITWTHSQNINFISIFIDWLYLFIYCLNSHRPNALFFCKASTKYESEPKLIFFFSWEQYLFLNVKSTAKHQDLQVPAVQWQPLRLCIHMFTYYHKYPTGHSAQRDYSGLNLSWHRNEQGSQRLRWLKLARLDGTCSTNMKTNCMPLGAIANRWHHLSVILFPWHDPDRVSNTQASCHVGWLRKSYEEDKDTSVFLIRHINWNVPDSHQKSGKAQDIFSVSSVWPS